MLLIVFLPSVLVWGTPGKRDGQSLPVGQGGSPRESRGCARTQQTPALAPRGKGSTPAVYNLSFIINLLNFSCCIPLMLELS